MLSAYPGLAAATIQPITSGLSQTLVWRITTGAQVYCLRKWPREHPGPERLLWMQQVLAMARENGCPFVPAPVPLSGGASFLEADDGLWELQTWQPGEPDAVPPSPARVRAAFQALARFHQATQRLGGEIRPAPALVERRDRLRQLLDGEAAAALLRISDRAAPPHVAPLAHAAETVFRRQGQLWLAELERLSLLSERLQPAIRDVRREHLLFVGDQVTGLVDFGALRIDTRLTDLARLLGSYCGEQPELRRSAVRAYAEINPLAAEEVARIDLIDHTGELISAFNWLKWLLLEEQAFARGPAAEARMAEISARLSQIAKPAIG